MASPSALAEDGVGDPTPNVSVASNRGDATPRVTSGATSEEAASRSLPCSVDIDPKPDDNIYGYAEDASLKSRASRPVTGTFKTINGGTANSRAYFAKKYGRDSKNRFKPYALGQIGEIAASIFLNTNGYDVAQNQVALPGYNRCWDLLTDTYNRRSRKIYWEVKVNGSRLHAAQRREDDRAGRAGFPIGYVWLKVNVTTGDVLEMKWNARK